MKTNKLEQRLPYLYIIAGAISFISAFVIMVEKLALAADPSHEIPCNINPLISCGSVMVTPQASVFGFPNPLLGIAGFAIVMTIGFALLAGAKFKRWYWVGIQLGMTFAVGFIYWLFHESVYEINALCLYCMVVWSMTIPLFLYTTVYNLKEGHIKLFGKKVDGFIVKRSTWILIAMYLVIIVAILQRFWDYWVTLF